MIRFGVFELDSGAEELRKHGIRVKLRGQPFQLLAALLEKPGEVVSREELRRRLWPADTFVDFDNSLNAAANKVREALSDSPSNPRFVETVPRRGYRFIAPVHVVRLEKSTEQVGDAPVVVPDPTAAVSQANAFRITRRGAAYWLAGSFVLILAVVTIAVLAHLNPSPSAASRTTTRTMLAVLPFQNLTNQSDREYFIAGLAEEMITKLGALQPAKLGVISRSSVFPYRTNPKPIREIGRELNVQYVLEGSVRSMGNRVRISLQLTQVADQTQLWSQNYERDQADVFAIQSDVARQVANALALQLLPNERAALERAATDNMAAYEEFLRGRYFWNQRTEDGLTRCRQHFQKAVGLDPNYALAYAGLADCFNLNGGYAIVSPREAFPRAKEAAYKALALDPSLARAHAALGFALLYYDWNWNEAELEFRRAIELNPNDSLARLSYAQLLRSQNRLDEAETQLRLAREVDPLDRVIQNYFGWIEFSRKSYDSAARIFQSVAKSYPSWSSAYMSVGFAQTQAGKLPEALAAFDRARLLSADSPSSLESYAHVAALAGKEDEARLILRRLVEMSKSRRISSYDVALIYTALGDKDASFRWLERGFAERDPWMIWLRVHPEWDPLRSDPRFQTLLAKMNLQGHS